MAEHTNTPWYTHNDIDGTEVIFDTNETIVAYAPTGPSHRASGGRVVEWGEGKANAEFIVRAVNSHEALLEACKAAIEQRAWESTDCTAWGMIRAAIALAEGKGE